ncbi:hypothetical protein [Cupriavidus pampae]|uniref:Uncharacterized protein n=1 Tax=Cupriavidus pampae TaxID=659251 RepID=A0ABM8WG12_9BURK|nr:hypothetical protein [Cupriavidus pampae]CAG9166047.1 hypothetical protein LMG32289_00913 [Cupriavidus pampae]
MLIDEDVALGMSTGRARRSACRCHVSHLSTVFEGRHVEGLEKATGYYKGDYSLPERRLTGYITKLNRPKYETAGTITIDSTFGDVERKVQVELTGDDYHLAVVAHDNSKMVRVEGDVHIKSKSAQLLNPKNFGVIDIEDLL